MELQDFIEFDENYFNEYPSWGEAPSTVWGLNENTVFEVKVEHDNPYELMNEFAVYGVTGKAILAIRGWGAPINEEDDVKIRPSEHPQRMRLVVYMYFDEYSEKIVVAVHEEGKDLMVMGSEGAGPLSEVAYECINQVKDVITNLKEIEAEA